MLRHQSDYHFIVKTVVSFFPVESGKLSFPSLEIHVDRADFLVVKLRRRRANHSGVVDGS